jgi:type IV pilus assembly protein PilO
VTLNNITISPQTKQAGAGDGLILETITKTFRYLDEEELAARRKAEPAAKGGRK